MFSPALRLRLRARLGTARLVAPAVRLEKKAGYSTPWLDWTRGYEENALTLGSVRCCTRVHHGQHGTRVSYAAVVGGGAHRLGLHLRRNVEGGTVEER